jgi:hypothetical protein
LGAIIRHRRLSRHFVFGRQASDRSTPRIVDDYQIGQTRGQHRYGTCTRPGFGFSRWGLASGAAQSLCGTLLLLP